MDGVEPTRENCIKRSGWEPGDPNDPWRVLWVIEAEASLPERLQRFDLIEDDMDALYS